LRRPRGRRPDRLLWISPVSGRWPALGGDKGAVASGCGPGAPGHRQTKERQQRRQRYRRALACPAGVQPREGTRKSGGPQRRSLRHRGMAQLYGPMALLAATRAVCRSAAAQWRTWRILGDPARSGQLRMRTRSRPAMARSVLGAATSRPRSPSNRARQPGWLAGESPGAHRSTEARPRPADATGNRRTPRPVDRPSRGVRLGRKWPRSSSRGRLRRVALEKALPAVIRYADARACRGAPRPPATDAPPAACAAGHPGPASHG
jgi:hypothetical protein